MTERPTPPWFQPEGTPSGILVNNSLVHSGKVPFVPKNGNLITWYICGPTVYNSSHMGHARNYVTFDILRRILQDYFHYDMFIVQNITDIDDKIIVRSQELKIPFTELARKYELEYISDMKALNVLMPDVFTRVSEYVPQIIKYIQGIIDKGYAYASNGSVYFDTAVYSKNHYYAKLEPNSVSDLNRVQEGEGGLSNIHANEKKNSGDFALWKKSKENEPSWPSNWGLGRPGWHIECSTMASDILGSNIDIHAGGVDLRFPHHDNELAQSEAYFDNNQWVNYFLHSGHLNIDKQKMSKSLKNFTTIRDGLQKYKDARSIRMLFLLHKWDGPMEYSEDAMSHAVQTHLTFNEFFLNIKVLLRTLSDEKNSAVAEQFWRDQEKEIMKNLNEKKKEIHQYLCDNFNTPEVIKVLLELVKMTNIYIKENTNVRIFIVNAIVNYIDSMLKVFGLGEERFAYDFSVTEKSKEEILTPVLDAFTGFRDKVRAAARAKDIAMVLNECDQVRDDTLPPLGIRMEDTSGASVWKLADVEILLQEREAKRAEKIKREADKLEREKSKREKEEKAKIEPKNFFYKSTG